MIEHAYKELYNQDSVDKQFVITYEGGEITNEDLYSESFELIESLCSQNELRFGSCEASMIKFKIANVVEALKDKWMTVSQVLAGKNNTPFQYGRYKVYSDVPSGDRNYRNITAYDAMYGVINAEMVEWYDGLTFPITMLDFRNSFFAYLGLEQVKVELVNDDMLIEKTIDADSISGKQIITAICELNGVFGHINRQGLFDYVSLVKRKQMIYPGMGIYPGSGIYPSMMVDNFGTVIYPSEDLYPSDELYPIDDLCPTDEIIRNYEHESISKSRYISCEHEDFETQLISKLQIRQEENDIGVIHGTGINTYIVQDNFLVYGKSSIELKQIASRMFTKINGVYYRPLKVALRGNPCVEVGDVVVVHTKYKEVESYVLERTIKGIQALRDTFESKGVYEYEEKVNSVSKEIKKLKGKTNVLERTVEQARSEIKDVESGMRTQIKQLSDSVAVVVDKSGKVITNLTLDRNGMSFIGDKVVFKSDNFNLDEEGNLSISGRYSVEYKRTFYAKDYSQSDVERVKTIVNNTITPTSEDYEKYDFKGTGIGAYSVVATYNLANNRYEWSTYTHRVTIDPEEKTSLIRTELLIEYSDSSLNQSGGSVSVGGMGISAGEGFFDTLEVSTGATGSFTTSDGKTVFVTSGIISSIS